jgi:putative endonuclease
MVWVAHLGECPDYIGKAEGSPDDVDFRFPHASLMYYVYILQSQRNGRYYIGCTHNMVQRLEQHNSGMTKSTRNLRPWCLVFTEEFETLSQARSRELEIKSWKNRTYMQEKLGLGGSSFGRASRKQREGR